MPFEKSIAWAFSFIVLLTFNSQLSYSGAAFAESYHECIEATRESNSITKSTPHAKASMTFKMSAFWIFFPISIHRRARRWNQHYIKQGLNKKICLANYLVPPFHVWSPQYLQMQDNFSSHLCCNLLKVFIWRLCAEWGGNTEQWVLGMKKLDSSILVIIGHHWISGTPGLILTNFKCLLGRVCVVCGKDASQEVQPLNWLCTICSDTFFIRQSSAKFI